jgi:acid phosphatase (class A)
MKRPQLLASALTAALVVGAATAQTPTPTPPRPRIAGYLAQALDGTALVPPPPAAGSPAEAADRAAYETTRAQAGTPRWAQAIEDAKLREPGAFRSWSCAAGVEIDATTTPALNRLLQRSLSDAGVAPNAPKELYKRPRPFVGNDKAVCLPREPLGGNGSYPSGHASVGWAWALILAEVVPGRAQAILQRGREFGESRMICGVHFPSDIEAGRTIGAGVVARLHAEPAFQADVAAARAEAAKAAPAKSCAT